MSEEKTTDELKAEDAMNAEEESTHAEEIHIEEEDLPEDDGPSLKEEFKMAGSEVVDFIKTVYREANVRRITVRNKHGRTLLDIPVTLGAVGLLPPVLLYTLGALGLAILTECSVTIERHSANGEETGAPADESA